MIATEEPTELINIPPTVDIGTPGSNFNFTAGSNLAISGTATDANGTISQVQIFNNAALLGTATLGAGTFSYSWNNVPAGTHSLTARATDNHTGVTTSAAVVSNTLPTANIGTPGSNFNFTAGSNLAISGTATDANGTISQVQIFNNAALLGTATLGAGTFSYSWNNVPAGTHSLTARATDNHTGVTTSAAVVSNTLPTANIGTPGSNFNFTAGSNLAISGTATDANGTISQVQIFNNGVLLGAATLGAGTFSYSWNNVPAGTHSLTARATDNHTGVTTSAAVVSNTLPTANIGTPGSNFNFTAGSNLAISGTATDANGTISQVQIFNNAALLGTATLGAGTFSYSWNNVPAGTHSLTARATDNHTGVTTSTAVVSNTLPTANIGTPGSNFNFTAGSNLAISGTATDANGTISQVQIFNNAALLGTATLGAGTFSYSWNNVPAGTHSLTARATDNHTGVTTSTAVVSNTLPTANIGTPGSNFNFTAGSNLAISGTATDANGTISQVQIFNNAALLGTATLGAGTFSYSWNNVPAGTHSLTARATDNHTGVTTSTAVVSNTLPTANIGTPGSNFNFTAGSNLAISGTATDANGTISQVQIFNNAALLGTATLGAGTFSYSWNNVPAGTHSLTARATDNHTGVTTSTAVVSNTLPTANIGTPGSNFNFTAGSNLAISGTATDANGTISQVQIFNNAALLGTATLGAGTFSYSWNNVPAGTHSLTARATDNHTGVTTSTAVVSNTLPTANIGTPGSNFNFTAGSNLAISGTATDANGTISQVQIFNNAALLGTATLGAGTFSYSWNNVPAGTHSLTARATDNHTGVTTSAAVVSNTPPTVSITSPANNSPFTAGSNLQINTTAADANGISRVDIYQGTTFLGQATSGISYLFWWNNVPAGTYALTAKATDNLGAVTTSTAITVISNTPPTVSITSPANNSTFTAGSTLQINTTASDANGISRVDIYQGTTFLGQATSGISYLFWWNNVPAGAYALTAKATDNLGAVTTSTAINISSTVGFNQFADGNANLTAMNFAPDGRLFVCQQTGQLKAETPFGSPAANLNVDRLLPDRILGPEVDGSQFVCVYKTTVTSVHNRVSLFTVNELWQWLSTS